VKAEAAGDAENGNESGKDLPVKAREQRLQEMQQEKDSGVVKGIK
jgi:hypothetical protein